MNDNNRIYKNIIIGKSLPDAIEYFKKFGMTVRIFYLKEDGWYPRFGSDIDENWNTEINPTRCNVWLLRKDENDPGQISSIEGFF